MVEEVLSDPKFIGKVAKHAIHLSDLVWRDRFRVLSETDVYNEVKRNARK